VLSDTAFAPQGQCFGEHRDPAALIGFAEVGAHRQTQHTLRESLADRIPTPPALVAYVRWRWKGLTQRTAVGMPMALN
jgi:hypothetical protein